MFFKRDFEQIANKQCVTLWLVDKPHCNFSYWGTKSQNEQVFSYIEKALVRQNGMNVRLKKIFNEKTT